MTAPIDHYCNVLKNRALAWRTQKVYTSIVRLFLAANPNHKRMSWADLSAHIASKQSRASVAQTYGALKLYWECCLKKPRVFQFIPFPKHEQRLPIIAPQDKILAAIQSLKNHKHRCMVTMLYAAGLRVSELVGLRWVDIIDRQALHVRGKGAKDRIVPISKRTLDTLIKYCKAYNLGCDTDKEHYVFGGEKPYSQRSVQAIINRLSDEAGIRLTPHLLRHACFSHMRNAGTDLAAIQEIAGHKRIETTRIYARLELGKVKMPI